MRIETFSFKTDENLLPTFQSLVFHSRIVFEVRTFLFSNMVSTTHSPLKVSEH